MTKSDRIIPTDRVRSGRRLAVDIDAPRDRTVCFTVSEDEKQDIDWLAASMNRTRSAVLTRIVTTFVSDALRGAEPTQLLELFNECREAVSRSKIPIERR